MGFTNIQPRYARHFLFLWVLSLYVPSMKGTMMPLKIVFRRNSPNGFLLKDMNSVEVILNIHDGSYMAEEKILFKSVHLLPLHRAY